MLRSLVWDRFRRALPYRARKWFKQQRWFLPVSKRLFGNEVYSRSYFADIERLEGPSSEHIAQWIVDRLGPGRAMDVGCGPGLLLAALARRGVEVVGVDISPAALELVKAKGLHGERFDLTDASARLPGAPYDLVISCEVAEHLEARFAPRFVQRLIEAGPLIYLTAAEPRLEQGPGLHHFNEQPNQYWIDLLEQRRWRLDEALTNDARRYLAEHDVVDYLRRPMIFRRSPGDAGAAGEGPVIIGFTTEANER